MSGGWRERGEGDGGGRDAWGIIYGVSPFQESGRETSAGQKSGMGVRESRIFVEAEVMWLPQN